MLRHKTILVILSILFITSACQIGMPQSFNHSHPYQITSRPDGCACACLGIRLYPQFLLSG
ncbi:MAG: hypothetical protein AB9891_19815 [Anaerolineaceae bacterium]